MNQIKTSLRASGAVSFRRSVMCTTVVAAALLAPAIIAWILNWHWAPTGTEPWMGLALLITNSGGFPYAVLTSVVLVILFALALGLTRPRSVLALVVLCLAAIVCGQIIKSLIKNTFQEPRPYVVWLADEYGLDAQVFYKMPREGRAAWLDEKLVAEARVTPPLRDHWQRETGFSFPSGHTSFVAIWAMLAGALLWAPGRGRRLLCCILVGWALAVEMTRLRLGMHWPIDVAVGVLLSWALVIVLIAMWKKFVMSYPDRGVS